MMTNEIDNRRGQVVVSRHGEQRVRKRMGLSKKAVEKLAYEAMRDGKRRSDFSGSFRRYLDKLWFSNNQVAEIIVHSGFVFIFINAKLVTMWNVPTKYRNTPRG